MPTGKPNYEFIDDYRKIKALEKMIPIQNYCADVDDNKVENKKFIRYKEEPLLGTSLPFSPLLTNPVITQYLADIQPRCHQQFADHQQAIARQTDNYKQISSSLYSDVKTNDYRFTFKYKDATPPPRTYPDSIGPNAFVTSFKDIRSDAQDKRRDGGDASMILAPRSKFDFVAITKAIHKNSQMEEESNVSALDEVVEQELGKYRAYKSLDIIDTIDSFEEEFAQFEYALEEPNLIDIEYVDNSILRANSSLFIDYFRDIGAPARCLDQYVAKHYRKDLAKELHGRIGSTVSAVKTKLLQKEVQNAQDQSERKKKKQIGEVKFDKIQREYERDKQETLYLYFLKPEQLKINKNDINFYDISNIVMGRITSSNAKMCIRSEKITKAQIDKLEKKLEKYEMRETDTGEKPINVAVNTDDSSNAVNMQKQLSKNVSSELNVEKLVEEINQIRKECHLLNQPTTTNKINASVFNVEVYNKLNMLLHVLYEAVIDKLQIPYKLEEISKHLDEVEGVNSMGYERIRLLWYIVTVYDEVLQKSQQENNLRSLLSKRNEQVKMTLYRQKKQSGITPKKQMPTKLTATRQMALPKSRTPIKKDKNAPRMESSPWKVTKSTRVNLTTK